MGKGLDVNKTEEFSSQTLISVRLDKSLMHGLSVEALLIDDFRCQVEAKGYRLLDEPTLAIEKYYKVVKDGMLPVLEEQADVISYRTMARAVKI